MHTFATAFAAAKVASRLTLALVLGITLMLLSRPAGAFACDSDPPDCALCHKSTCLSNKGQPWPEALPFQYRPER
jgi:hypothetical protein